MLFIVYQMENENYVTVVPVEYSQPSRSYLKPPQQYSDRTNYGSITHGILKNSETEDIPKVTKRQNDHGNSSKEEQRESYLRYKDEDIYLKVCVYLMNDVVLHMELEDGTNTTVSELISVIINLNDLPLSNDAKAVFTLWMCSGLLELQLKPYHKPLLVRSKWQSLLSRFAHATLSRQSRDEPVLSFRRNVFYPLSEEEKIVEPMILELLYEEAKYNVLEGRYPCEMNQYIMLGGIQARLELGPYEPEIHTNKFFRSLNNKFLPVHIRYDIITSWFRSRIKNSPEVRLFEHFKRIPASATNVKLQRRYLEVCWTLPYYGSAFFHGQIEEPVRGLTSLLLQQDMPVLVGINGHGLYLIDNVKAKLILGLRYEEFSWDLGKPTKPNPNCLSCIFIQFSIIENGAKVSKVLQIFSKQADMMDALISSFVDEKKSKSRHNGESETDSDLRGSNTNESQLLRLPNKLSKFNLATFDDEGRCIGQMGSLMFV